MPTSPIFLFSGLSIIITGLLGFVIFFLSFKENNKLHMTSLRHWALAFFLFSWVRIPVFFWSIGITMSTTRINTFYSIVFVASTIAFILFYRGIIILFTNKRFWKDTLPIIIFVTIIPSIFFLYFVLDFSIGEIGGIVRVFHYLVIAFFVFGILLKSWIQKSRRQFPVKAKIGTLFIVFGWTIFVLADIIIQRSYSFYPRELWFSSLTSLPYVYLFFSIAHILLIVGFIFTSFHLETFPPEKKKLSLLAGISSFIIFGAIIFSVASQPINETTVSLVPQGNNYVRIEDEFSVDVIIKSHELINTVGVLIEFDSDIIQVKSVKTENSIIKLWVQQPLYLNEDGRIELSGIVLGGFMGEGNIATIVFKAKDVGVAKIKFLEATILAHDGEGTEILNETIGTFYTIQGVEILSPDINNDGKINLLDVSIVMFHYGEINKPEYDLNQDGRINLIDISILISFLLKGE